jgi:hypothetical protein
MKLAPKTKNIAIIELNKSADAATFKTLPVGSIKPPVLATNVEITSAVE